MYVENQDYNVQQIKTNCGTSYQKHSDIATNLKCFYSEVLVYVKTFLSSITSIIHFIIIVMFLIENSSCHTLYVDISKAWLLTFIKVLWTICPD